MVHPSIIEARLSKLGVKLSRWFKPEIQELQNILIDNEEIYFCVPGRYFGGYAMLLATDHRLLLIDKKAFFMNLEDIRYDMVSEIDFSSRVFDATLMIFTINKQHRFTSAKYKKSLRQLASYVQRQIVAIRQYQAGLMPASSEPAVQSLPRMFNYAPHIFRRHASPHTHKLVGAAAIMAHHRSFVRPSLATRNTNTMFGRGQTFTATID